MTTSFRAGLQHSVGVILPAPIKVKFHQVLNSDFITTFQKHQRVFGLAGALKLISAERRSTPFRVFSRELGRKIRLRPKTSDLQVALQILDSHEYGMAVDFEPQLIVDAGAYTGISSLFFAKRFPKATIHAIEPDTENFNLLLANCRGVPNIIAHNAALWPRHTALAVRDAQAEKWMISVRESAGDGETPAITISDVMQQAHADTVDILKLDIEGGEKELFTNGVSKWLPFVRMIVIELHDRYVPGCSSAFYSSIATREFSKELMGENVVVRFSDC